MTVHNFHDVGAFHLQFNLPVQVNGEGKREWNGELIAFRSEFLQEELDEFNKGVSERDHVQMADALVDLVYVALGTAHLLNYPWLPLWNDVQRANMSKVRAATDGSDSKRASAWDVVKPEGWEPPHTGEILTNFGFNLEREPERCAWCEARLDRVPSINIVSRRDSKTTGLRFCTMLCHDRYMMPENFPS